MAHTQMESAMHSQVHDRSLLCMSALYKDTARCADTTFNANMVDSKESPGSGTKALSQRVHAALVAEKRLLSRG